MALIRIGYLVLLIAAALFFVLYLDPLSLILFLVPSIIGFAERECEQIGVIQKLSVNGSIIGPPADIE